MGDLEAARRLLENNDANGAIDLAMVALAAGADPALAASIAGRAFHDKNMSTDALAWLDRSISIQPSAEALACRALIRYERDENELALLDCARAGELDPAYGWPHLIRGSIYAERDDLEAALRELELAAADATIARRVLTQRGRLLYRAKRKDEARVAFAAAADLGHTDAAEALVRLDDDLSTWTGPALLALAEHRSRNDEDEAAATFEAAIAKLEDPYEALVGLGAEQRARKEFDAAIDAYRKAAALRPQSSAAAQVARTLYFADRNREAEAALAKLIAAGGAPFVAHFTLGQLCREEARLDEALAAFDAALACDATPGDRREALVLRGRVLLALDRRDDARAAWHAAEAAGAKIEDDRRDEFGDETANDFFSSALQMIDMSLWGEAEPLLERAAELFREKVRATGDFASRELANVLQNLGHAARNNRDDLAGAAARFEEAIRVNPMSYQRHMSLGSALHEQGRHREACEIHDRAVSLAYGAPMAHYNRGLARMGLGDADGAAEDFTKALAYKQAAQRADALFNLVKSLWRAGRFDDARAACVEHGGDDRFVDALDLVLARGKAEPDAHPFRFYGVDPERWQEDDSHVYRARFRNVPDEPAKRAIAEVAAAFEIHRWTWSGPYVELALCDFHPVNGESLFQAIHDACALEEVVYLNAQSPSTSDAGAAWEQWSIAMQPLLAPHPFKFDGHLWFSAYGTTELPAPAPDPVFDEMWRALTPTRDVEDEDEQDEQDLDDDEDEELEDGWMLAPDSPVQLADADPGKTAELDALRAADPAPEQRQGLPAGCEWYSDLSPFAEYVLGANFKDRTVAWVDSDHRMRKLDIPLSIVFFATAPDRKRAVMCDQTTVHVVDLDTGVSKPLAIDLDHDDGGLNYYNGEVIRWAILAVGWVGNDRVLVQTIKRVLLVDLDGNIVSERPMTARRAGLDTVRQGQVVVLAGEGAIEVCTCDGTTFTPVQRFAESPSFVFSPDGQRCYAQLDDEWREIEGLDAI